MKTAREAAQFLADQAVKVAELAAKFDDGSRMQVATVRRAEVMMDCAKMLAEKVKETERR